jgi:serine/threonine protein kinase
MLAQEPPRPAIRRLLAALLRTDSDYTAFCIDYFPAVAHEFTSGLTRTDKTNLLLEQVAGALVIQQLQAICANVDVLAQLSQIVASLPLAERQAGAQRAALEQLYLLREQRRADGSGFAELDTRIVQLKRAQRESTQRKEGDLLGERYWLQHLIGKGGYARVWQAFDRTALRLVALKILHRDLSDDPRRLDRFCRGVAKLRAIHHPHIVSVYSEIERDGDAVFVAMEYLPGGDLHNAVVHRKLPRPAALGAVIEICDALAYMHAAGMIHRDVKPQNILLTGDGRAKLTDFDLVWAVDTTGATRTGSLGTFMYAAPEAMVDGSDATCRADVYSVAMTLLFVLHGRALPANIQYDLGRFIDKIDAPAKLKALLKRATQVDPARRTATVQLLRSELLQAAEPLLREPVAPSAISPLRGEAAFPTKKRSQVVFVLAFLLLGTGGAAYWWSNRPPVVDPEAEAAKLLVDVEGDLQAKRWPQAIEKTSKVIYSPAVSAKSRDLATTKRRNAEQESKVKVVYERFATAAGGAHYDQALRTFKEIPEDSVYRSGARDQYDQIFPLFVASHIKAAEDARAQGNCAEFQAELKVVLDIDSKQVKALAAGDRPCGDKSTTTTDNPSVATNTKPDKPGKTEIASADVDQALTDAQTEFVNGNFRQSISMAKAVQRGNPTRAWRIIGASACTIKDVKLASEAFRHLDSAGRQYMIYRCDRHGIAYSGSQLKFVKQ